MKKNGKRLMKWLSFTFLRFNLISRVTQQATSNTVFVTSAAVEFAVPSVTAQEWETVSVTSPRLKSMQFSVFAP